MTGKIPRSFIINLLKYTDIVDLINKRIQLKKTGKNFQAYCPFHNEKNPSFTVSREKQFYYCFGCGAHGNAIDFLMKYDQLNFTESVEELAIQNNLDISYSESPGSLQRDVYRRKELYHIMNKICNFYHEILNKEAKQASFYLKTRGLNKSTITHFRIGFAPPTENNITRSSNHSKKNFDLLKSSGMIVIDKNGQAYDRFRNRIMFPIRNKYGNVIAFGGRTLGNNHPKYLNSPDTEIFHKGKCLYGLYEIQRKYSKLKKLLVVEGYIDVISLFQFGINYVVSPLGTSITTYHIQSLCRITDSIIFCYDGDHAGRKAASRTLENILPYLIDEKQVQFVFLPEGEDPDTLIHKIGKSKFEELIKKATSISNLLFEIITSQIDSTDSDNFVKLTTLAFSLIKKIPGKILRFHLIQELGNRIGLPDGYQLNKLLPKKKFQKHSECHLNLNYSAVRTLTTLLIQHPHLAYFVPTTYGIKNLNQDGTFLFVDLVYTCRLFPQITTAQLLEYYRWNKFYPELETLATWNHMIVDEMIELTFIDTLLRIYDSILEMRQRSLITRARIHSVTYEERKELWLINQELNYRFK